MKANLFDRDYFEHGIETGKSRYQNYRWMPEATMSMAMRLIDLLSIKSTDAIIDFGCAKGYLVKAFRLLHRDAIGLDVSSYAIENCDPDVASYCYRINGTRLGGFEYVKWIIAKDVFEHIPEENLIEILNSINAQNMFVCVPLGKNGKYNAPANDLDTSHVICENMDWWRSFFSDNGWEIIISTNNIKGLKTGYYSKYPEAHAFFILKKR